MSGYKITNSDGVVLVTTGKGVSIPTIDAIQNASTSVPTGTIIYSLADGNIYRYNGTSWLVSAGTSGSAGSSGQSGTSGTAGSSGSTGTSGTSGSSGASGSSGSAGSSGSTGSSGSSGSSGTAGTAGSSGVSGTSGTAGSAGSSGSSGSAGSTGTSGSSGTGGSSGSSGATVPGGFSIQYSGTTLSGSGYETMKIVYTSESLITSGGTLFISGNDGNNNVIQNGTSATVLDKLIARAGTGSTGHILRIFERDDSTKVNFYTYTSFNQRLSPTNTDANFIGLTYIGGTGNSTFSKPCLGLEIVGANGTSGVAGSSGQTGAAGSSGSSGSSGQTGAAGSSGSSGSSGQSGAAGSSGSSGQTGATGSSGSSGSSGQTGAAGSSGSSGSSGTRGSSGSSGSSGQSGAAGSSGSSGQTGGAGSSGSSGSSGQTGAAGSSGSSGQSAATAITNNTNNYVVTATGNGTTPFNGESNLIFDGTNLGVSAGSPIANIQVNNNTFTGANGVNSNGRVGVMLNGSLTSYVYASTYNDPTYPDYGFVFIHGPNTTTYNVWSISPDGPAKGSGLHFIYGASAANIHTATPRVSIIGSTGNMTVSGTISASNFSGTSSGTNTGDQTNISGNAVTVSNLTAVQFFNNMGQTHGFRTSFDASSPSYDFGFRYVQGTGNGPGTGGGAPGQFYSLYIGLGSEYPATGGGSYGMYLAIDRNSDAPYLSVRYNENNTLSTWRKIRAGYADSAGTATDSSKLPLAGGTITGTLSMATTGTNYIRMGVFPNSTTNTGEAWIGRASDRNAGTMTVQLGGNSASGRSFEVVDYAWSVVLFNVNSNGTATASGDLIAYSDARVKTNIKSINNSLEKVLKLNGVTYNRIDSEDKSTKIGFIAQDVEKVVPEVVTYDGKIDRYGISYGNVAALLVEAIKEQQTQIEDQGSEIRRLKSLIGSLLGKNYK
jgi:collagen type VII alpha